MKFNTPIQKVTPSAVMTKTETIALKKEEPKKTLSTDSAAGKGKWVPPHLRARMEEEAREKKAQESKSQFATASKETEMKAMLRKREEQAAKEKAEAEAKAAEAVLIKLRRE